MDPLSGIDAEHGDVTTAGVGADRESPGPLLRLIKDQRIAFVLVGAANTAVALAVFTVCLRIWNVQYMVALLIAHVCAVLFAFVLHRRLVFRVRGRLLGDLWRFELVNLTSLLINAALLPLGVEVVGMPPLVAQLVVTLVTMFISFFGHRDFSFRRRRHEQAVS